MKMKKGNMRDQKAMIDMLIERKRKRRKNTRQQEERSDVFQK